eukprot:UN04356
MIRPEDYYDDVHISLNSVIDAGEGWLTLNKPSCISLENHDGYDCRSRIRRLLKNPRHKVISEQIGINPHEEYPIYLPQKMDEGTSGVLLAFNEEVYQSIKQKKITETVYAIVKPREGRRGIST